MRYAYLPYPTHRLMGMTATELLKWTCPDCGLLIESLYKRQFEYNVEQHKGSHKKK